MKVVEYVTEEVERQGHDTTTLDGIERVGWMLEAWVVAMRKAGWRHEVRPTVMDALKLGKLVERQKNKHGIRVTGVYVHVPVSAEYPEGIKRFPKAEDVPGLLDDLFRLVHEFKPLEFYREFLNIHPFIDGNGRTGKILLNWLAGTMYDPIFPPNDFWGHPMRNP